MEEGTIGRWLKKEGEPVEAGEDLLEITTDKLTNAVRSEHAGILLKIIAAEGMDVPVKGLLGYVGRPGEQTAAPDAAATVPEMEKEPLKAAAAEVPTRCSDGARVRISPLARKMADEMGIDYSGLTGSGPGGRVVRRDIEDIQTAVRPAPAASLGTGAFPVKALERMEGDAETRLSAMRRSAAQRMYAAAVEIPAVTQTVKADVTELCRFRKQLNEGRERKFSLNDFILKAVAKAVRKHPEVRVSLDGDTVIHRSRVNLGMAVALEDGLIVPVIRDADRLCLEELAGRAGELAVRARENRLQPDEYRGSTFTVSNLGMFGVESFTPIINQPDAAILGANCVEEELALAEDGRVVGRRVMRLSLTYDHRLMDGAAAARFQQTVRELLHCPMDILL